MNLKERVFKNIDERKQKVLNGEINSIPSPFKRFSNDYIGLEKGKYYVCTANTKVGKTTFASFLFLYSPLLYAYNHRNTIRFKVFYYPLEETQEDVLYRFMCFALYYLSKGKIVIDRNDLKSSKNVPLSDEIRSYMDNPEYQSLIDFFIENVTFSTSTNPSGVWKEMVRYAEDNGTVFKKKVQVKDEFGVNQEIEVFDHYEANDPNEVKLIFFDHVSLVSLERGFDLKRCIDKLGEYFVILRNKYEFSICEIHQQNTNSESLDAVKLGKAKASINYLADSSYSARNCDFCIGLNSPFRQELPDWNGYSIKRFKDFFRYAEVLLNRSGSAGGVIPLFYIGKVCWWQELPVVEDEEALAKFYNYKQQLEKL